MRRNARVIALVLTCAAFLALAAGQQSPPDLVLLNGKVFTSDHARLFAQALAISGDRVTAVGESDKIRSLAGPHTRIVDLAGYTVIPGINDAHDHISPEPRNTVDLDVEGFDPPWDAVKAALQAAVVKAPPGAFLHADIGSSIFRDVSVDRNSLDVLAPRHPVILETFTGHAMILNSAALSALKIDEAQSDPLGGRYERDAQGKLTGVIREYAVMQVARKLGEATADADGVAELRDALSRAAKWGITSIQDMPGSIDAGRAVALLEKVPPQIRVRVIRMPVTTRAGRSVNEDSAVPAHPAPLISVSGTKWMLDGVPIEFTMDPRDAHKSLDPAHIEKEFVPLPLTFSAKEIGAIVHETIQSRDQLLVHVSGYISAKDVLEALEESGGEKVWAARRVRFEHGDCILPDLIPEVRKLGIIVVQNPTHFAALAGIPNLNVGNIQPFRSLLNAGIPVALGSDGPMNPYLNIMLATTHPHRPSEAISREEAVIAYTRTSAYAEFAEADKGTLAPGKLADLAVLSQDIFSIPLPDLPKTESVLTLVGGKTVYDAKVLAAH